MNEELCNKLIKDLEKSGFASEMRALKIFSSLGWRSQAGKGYFDKDENVTREVDISAHLSIALKHQGKFYCSIFMHIIADVKKSETPWIVFRNQLGMQSSGCAWNNIIFSNNLPQERFRLSKYISKSSLLKTRGWAGTGIHHAFKDPTTPSRWYKSFISVCKACEDAYEIESSFDLRGSIKETTDDVLKDHAELVFFQPLVILDGSLIAVSLSHDSELQLEEISSAPFRFEFRTKNYCRDSYRVDLVTVDGLKEYLASTRQRLQDISEGVQELAASQLQDMDF